MNVLQLVVTGFVLASTAFAQSDRTTVEVLANRELTSCEVTRADGEKTSYALSGELRLVGFRPVPDGAYLDRDFKLALTASESVEQDPNCLHTELDVNVMRYSIPSWQFKQYFFGSILWDKRSERGYVVVISGLASPNAEKHLVYYEVFPFETKVSLQLRASGNALDACWLGISPGFGGWGSLQFPPHIQDSFEIASEMPTSGWATLDDNKLQLGINNAEGNVLAQETIDLNEYVVCEWKPPVEQPKDCQ